MAYTNVTAASIPINQTNETTSTTTILISPFCEGNLDCDQDVDGTDASTFKADFGRNKISGNPCLSLTDCPSNPWQPCPEGMIVCGPIPKCVNPMTDEANCGGCNVICSDTCVNGTCQQVGCPPNFTWCDSECADTTTDEANCGGCGNECSDGQFCINGECKLPYTCSGTLSPWAGGATRVMGR